MCLGSCNPAGCKKWPAFIIFIEGDVKSNISCDINFIGQHQKEERGWRAGLEKLSHQQTGSGFRSADLEIFS